MDFQDMAHDWRRLVRERLNLCHAVASDREEIVAELASHLEELFDEQRESGLPEAEATERALSEVCNWERLNRRIQRAKREEDKMNDRTRHLWLPGLASFAAAVICEVLLARWSYQPRVLLSSHHLTQMMYGLWLIAQLVCGAVGAYLSRRAGGTRPTRLAAALFTSAILLIAMLGVVGTSLFARVTGFWRQDFGSIDLLMIAKVIGVMIVIPSVALLVGALPFLTERKEMAAA
jgi:hypothetical protein